MSMLSKYKELHKDLISVPWPAGNISKAQEVHYRIYVLEEFRMFSQTLQSLSSDEDVKKHFSLFIWFLSRIEKEFSSVSKIEEVQVRRNQAKGSLSDVIYDFRKRMLSLSRITAEEYAQIVNTEINAVIPAWIVYRDTLTEIKFGK